MEDLTTAEVKVDLTEYDIADDMSTFVEDEIRNALDNFIGLPNNENTRMVMENAVMDTITKMLDNGVIESMKEYEHILKAYVPELSLAGFIHSI